jgi:hypothetical protein
MNGWQYSNHDKFTDEQRAEFTRQIKTFTEEGNVTVIGDVYEDISGWTTTVEGITTVFDNLMRDKDEYDIVILDYYQNVTKSREQPELNEYEVQRVLSNEFDRIKNAYPGVIVVMAQVDALKDEDDKTPHSVRLKGTKMITTKCTFICEIVPDYDLFKSDWVVHKSRFTDSMGHRVITGFDRGMYVPYSTEFQKNISKIVNERLERKKAQELGMPVEKEEKKKRSKDE